MSENETSRLQYLDAGDIDDDRVDFDALDVLDPIGKKLGELDGFVVGRDTKRPYYVVVDSGGWFASRSFLVPIGHARLDPANEALRVDLDKDTIGRFPQFDEDQFAGMSDEDVRAFNERTLLACCSTELQARTGPDRYDFDKWSHFAQPDWWRREWLSSPGAIAGTTVGRAVPGTATYDIPPAGSETTRRERVTAQDRTWGDRDIDVERAGEERVSGTPPTKRAQPGDVLGIERGGETTSLGDTARTERERLEDEEADAAKLREKDEKERKDRR